MRRIPYRTASGRTVAVLLALLLASTGVHAQASPPGTDIHLIPMRIGEGVPVFGTPLAVTSRAGYDNQPSFTPDGGAILYTSIRADAQADIYRYDIASRATVQVIRTAESEYSPTVTPDGRGISVIRVEADSTQRLWRFLLDGTNPHVILPEVRPVGYHAWVGDTLLALFVLGSPATLQLADVRQGTARVVASGIGRSIHRVPGRDAISFVSKRGAGDWWIEVLDLASMRINPLVRTLPGSEDYAWLGDGVLMARGNTIHFWAPGHPPEGEGSWREAGRFDDPSLHNITRMAASPAGDRLAVVSAPPPG